MGCLDVLAWFVLFCLFGMDSFGWVVWFGLDGQVVDVPLIIILRLPSSIPLSCATFPLHVCVCVYCITTFPQPPTPFPYLCCIQPLPALSFCALCLYLYLVYPQRYLFSLPSPKAFVPTHLPNPRFPTRAVYSCAPSRTQRTRLARLPLRLPSCTYYLRATTCWLSFPAMAHAARAVVSFLPFPHCTPAYLIPSSPPMPPATTHSCLQHLYVYLTLPKRCILPLFFCYTWFFLYLLYACYICVVRVSL